jgi:imidazolonepropionase-like amidohydrolase
VVRTLYRDAALADGHSPDLRVGVSVLVDAGRIAWIHPTDDEPDPGDADVVDAGGTTIVPGMVDSHSHLTLPGGSHWIERGGDPTETLLRVAEENGALQRQAGVRWARDVGAPTRVDPTDGRERALTIGIRERWRSRPEHPYVRAGGTWVARAGYLPDGLAVAASDADAMVAAALRQLDDGADFVKLMMDGPEPGVPPWSTDEVRRVVEAVHARGARITAHSGEINGARVCAEAGVDSIEHGFELEADVARLMATNGVALSSTLTVMRSWATFGRTTRLPRFFGEESQTRIRDRYERAKESVRQAHRAGLLIAAGTDFGGGSSRANQLAWEVESLVEAGLEPWEALAAATWHGGEILGEPEAGTIRPGGPADFFLVHGDPLSDPAALWRVWRVAWP